MAVMRVCITARGGIWLLWGGVEVWGVCFSSERLRVQGQFP